MIQMFLTQLGIENETALVLVFFVSLFVCLSLWAWRRERTSEHRQLSHFPLDHEETHHDR